MDNQEARSLLSVHRSTELAHDARLREAEERAKADPDLARWWQDEQELDRVIGAKLAGVAIPSELKTRVLERQYNTAVPRFPWRRAALAIAAIIIALAVFFGSWRGPFRPAASLADYRDEMVSFLKVTPSLELETNELSRIHAFLAKSGAPSDVNIPQSLRDLEPVGCRKLRFRGNDVALICFKRGNGRVAHLLVVNRAAMRGLRDTPQYATEGDWATAAWSEGDRGYLLAVQGDDSTAEKFLSDS